MDLDGNCLPEEFVDILVQNFAYDPIRLPISEDPSQILYNRRTLETIWDSKRDAINPYTRQPFHIGNVIPQSELRQRMREFILDNNGGLHVIPDYTQILNKTGMKNLLEELVAAANQCLLIQKTTKKRGRRNQNRKADDCELEKWNALWSKLNLVRLYCQYRIENRELFCSIKGYEYLFQVTSKPLLNSCVLRRRGEYSCDDAKEVCKEVARIVDVVGGLKETDLQMAQENSVLAFVRILFDLANHQSQYFKIQSMVLRIYCRMFDHCIDYLVRSKKNSILYMLHLAVYVLASRSDIVNEELYNGMTILKVAWINDIYTVYFMRYVDVLYRVVTICVSRLQDLHDAQYVSCSTPQELDALCSCTGQHADDINAEMENNIRLLSMALEHGLFLIFSLVTTPHNHKATHGYAGKERLQKLGVTTPHNHKATHGYAGKERLQNLGIVKRISRMEELANAGNRLFQSSHLELGLKIIAALS